MYVFVLCLQFGAVLTSASTHIIKLSRVPGLRVLVIMIFKYVCESNGLLVSSNVFLLYCVRMLSRRRCHINSNCLVIMFGL